MDEKETQSRYVETRVLWSIGMAAKDEIEAKHVDSRLSSHEELCALRYDMICARLKRLEQILIGTAAFIIATLLAVAMKVH